MLFVYNWAEKNSAIPTGEQSNISACSAQAKAVSHLSTKQRKT